MNPFDPRRVFALLAVLIVSAANAHASGTDGTALDESALAAVVRAPKSPSAPTVPIARSLQRADEAPCTPTCGRPTAAGSLTRKEAPAPPGTLPLRHRGVTKAKRERPPATGALNAQRTTPNRGKAATHATPATPSMGALLRMGTSAGREISLDLHCVPRPGHAQPLMGRAPPHSGALAVRAQASPPRRFTLATPTRAPRTQATPGAPLSSTRFASQSGPAPLADRGDGPEAFVFASNADPEMTAAYVIASPTNGVTIAPPARALPRPLSVSRPGREAAAERVALRE